MSILVKYAFLTLFLSVAVLGFAAMSHDMSQHDGCIVATAEGADCAAVINPVALFSLHTDFLKSSFLAVTQFSAPLFVFAGIVLLAFVAFSLTRGLCSKSRSCVWRVRISERLFAPLEAGLAHWLALFEHSPERLIRADIG